MRRHVLAPLVPLYAAGVIARGVALRLGLETVHRLERPVISVGSLSAGGAGKTPFTIALARLIQSAGMSMDVLSRGYGRQSVEILRVDPTGDAEIYGDEPLLIARSAGVPVFVGPSRWRVGRLAEMDATALPDIHLLDDGFQHRQLHRAMDIALVSTPDLEDWLLPAGNRREPLSALRRAHIFAVDAQDDNAAAQIVSSGLEQPIWRYQRHMTVSGELPQRVVAFCGIARPGQFFGGLRAAGFDVAAECVFGDHHTFRKLDCIRLKQKLEQAEAGAFVTTAKDAVRLGRLREMLEDAAPLRIADILIEILDPHSVTRSIQSHLATLQQADCGRSATKLL